MKVLTIAEWQRPVPLTAVERARLKRLQGKAEQAVDRLIALLDEIAADPDLEDSSDGGEADDLEPSLGSLERMTNQSRWSGGCADDLEHEHDGRERDDEGDELDTLEASDLEVSGESDQLDFSEEAVAPSLEYRERLRQRRGEPARRSTR